MNVIIISGRLVRDAEMSTIGSKNTPKASFSLAVNRRFKREGQPNADFFPVNAFGAIAEFMGKYGKQGVKFEISGHLQQDRWTDRDGKNQTRNTIIAESIEFAESRAVSKANTGGNTTAAPAKPTTTDDMDDFAQIDPEMDELPFG